MPWLAAASAQMQGKALVEVCTTYGVATVVWDGAQAASGPVAADKAGPGHAPEGSSSAHGSDHCVLTALAVAAGGGTAPALALLARALVEQTTPDRRATPLPPDACAGWVAQRRHGPPEFS